MCVCACVSVCVDAVLSVTASSISLPRQGPSPFPSLPNNSTTTSAGDRQSRRVHHLLLQGHEQRAVPLPDHPVPRAERGPALRHLRPHLPGRPRQVQVLKRLVAAGCVCDGGEGGGTMWLVHRGDNIGRGLGAARYIERRQITNKNGIDWGAGERERGMHARERRSKWAVLLHVRHSIERGWRLKPNLCNATADRWVGRKE